MLEKFTIGWKAAAKKETHTEQVPNASTFTEYFDKTGKKIGTLYNDSKMKIVQIGQTTYVNKDNKNTIDSIITTGPDVIKKDNKGITYVNPKPKNSKSLRI